MQELDLSLLPDLPQKRFLARVLADLWQDPAVLCISLTGSLARGAGDIYSDVDLGVALRPELFDPDQLPASARLLGENTVAHQRAQMGEHATLHHLLLAHGELYDLLLYTPAHPLHEQHRVVLACRDESLAARLAGGDDPTVRFPPADGAAIRESVVMFWMAQLRHQKVLYRDLGLVAWMGEQLMRQELIRLWYVLETGNDCGPLRQMTIHTLSPVVKAVRAARGDGALELIGQPLRTRQEILEATIHIRDEFMEVARRLAERLGFDYPEEVEATVMRGWQELLRAIAHERAEAVRRWAALERPSAPALPDEALHRENMYD